MRPGLPPAVPDPLEVGTPMSEINLLNAEPFDPADGTQCEANRPDGKRCAGDVAAVFDGDGLCFEHLSAKCNRA